MTLLEPDFSATETGEAGSPLVLAERSEPVLRFRRQSFELISLSRGD